MNVLSSYALISLLLFACNSGSSIQINQECDSLKNGKFFYRSELSNNTYTVDRKDSLQTEVNNLTKEASRWKITWTGPCQFEGRSLDDSLKYPDPIIFRIIKKTSKYYIFEASRTGSNRILSDTLFKIN
jgi:hypothetical protein